MLPTAIVFDLNETLLDFSALDPLFADAFGDKGVRRTWFAQTLQNAMSATILDSYAEFTELARVALDMTARTRGVNIDDERKRRILRGMNALPPHGDVRAGLERLSDAGFRLAALTNSSETTARAQLEHARIVDRFELVLSADDVRRFKPASEVYRMAAERLGVPIASMLVVAAHGWDVAGAMHAGAAAAFVARHGSALNPLEPGPAYVVHDVVALADVLRRAA